MANIRHVSTLAIYPTSDLPPPQPPFIFSPKKLNDKVRIFFANPLKFLIPIMVSIKSSRMAILWGGQDIIHN